MNQLEEAIANLAERIIQTGTGLGPYNHLSCSEIEPLETLLRGTGHDHAADVLVLCHAPGDDDETDLHHGLYLLSEREDVSDWLGSETTTPEQLEVYRRLERHF